MKYDVNKFLELSVEESKEINGGFRIFGLEVHFTGLLSPIEWLLDLLF